MSQRTTLAAMAWKNLWRNGRRTALTLVSIGFGLFLAVMMTGIQEGSFGTMIDLAARLGAGHVTIQHPDALDSPGVARTVRGADGLRRVATGERNVERAVERISGEVMLSTAGHTYGAAYIAYDPAQEDAATLSLLDAIAEGEGFPTADHRGIIVGAKLAENLGVGLGRKIVYTLTDKDGELVRDVSRVSGLIHTGSPVDRALVLFPINRMRDVLGYAPGETSQIAIFVDDQRRAAGIAERLSGSLGEEEAALAWFEIQPELAGFITMKVVGARLMIAVIVLLIAAGIFNTLFISVMERVREFGILLAIGFSPGRLFSLVMLESLFLGIVGVVLGAVVTAGPYYYLSRIGIDVSSKIDMSQTDVAGVAMDPILRASIFPETLAVIVALALAATLLSGLYPAWKAGRVSPVEAIRVG